MYVVELSNKLVSRLVHAERDHIISTTLVHHYSPRGAYACTRTDFRFTEYPGMSHTQREKLFIYVSPHMQHKNIIHRYTL